MKTKTNNKCAYLNNIPINHGEMTVITSGSAEDIMAHSARTAAGAQKAGMSVLLINCGMSKNRFMEHIIEHNDVGLKHPCLIVKSSIRGELINEGEEIRQALGQEYIRVVILAGWEWASNSWRKKNRLLYFLREIMEDYGVTVIVYASKFHSPVAGEIDRGGLGDLPFFAMFVIALSFTEQLEKNVPKPPVLYMRSNEEFEAMERSAQLLLNKVNDLQGENEKIRGSWDKDPSDEEEALAEV
jgi:hypothetical protein